MEIRLISKLIKGRTAKRFICSFNKKGNDGISFLKDYRAIEKGKECYRIWQTGGGFDRNLWNPEAIHQSIEYIEANPVRKKLAESPEKYRWSSAFAKVYNEGVVPDRFNVPVKMANPQYQRTGFVG